MRILLKRLAAVALSCALACLACMGLVACDDEDSAAMQVEETDSNETWAVYWYLCGSDLESEYGAATADLEEMMSAELSENVQVVVQTGGAASWESEVDPSVLQRYSYTTDGLELVDEQPVANMGEAATLADFLSFCSKNYPADHVAVVLWNHGGGTVGGVAYDELYDYDSLSLEELHEAFAQAYDLSADDPPIDVLGFDACLMGSIDVASAVSDVASYLVASEESEPGCGWEYEGLFTGLSRDTGMSGKRLGRLICDSYLEGCEDTWQEDEATLSVVDLQKVPALVEAYDAVGAEALDYVQEDATFYAQYARCAEEAENYGGNTPSSGYGDMVDLGDLMRGSSNILPQTSDELLSLLDECVVYKVRGPYRENATGLSCYHAYDGVESYEAYCDAASSESFVDFYGYSLTGEAPVSGAQGSGDVPAAQASEADSLDDFPVQVGADGSASLELGAELASELSSVLVHVAYYDAESDIAIDFGNDIDLSCDWEEGVFTENFWGSWGALDGALCYREVVYEGDDYIIYAIPILLNGEECTLGVVYSYSAQEYEILGARADAASNADDWMADKWVQPLSTGDEVTMLHYAASISGDDDFTQFEGDTITVTDDTTFADASMGDGTFMLFFDMRDGQNNSYLSAPVYFTVEDGEIYTEV